MTPEQRAAAERLIAEHPTLFMNDLPDWCDDAFHLLRELAEVPVQEPVAYIDPRQLAAGYVTLRCITRPEYRSYADVAEGVHYTPVYLHPPQQRKPLLRGEIIGLWKDRSDGPSNAEIISFARAIERAHGITGEPT